MNPIDAVREGRRASVRLERDGRSFHCAPGQTVLAAALAAGIDLPYECASGSCGGCRARLLAGAVTSLWADAPGLSERDRHKGDRILCCQSIAQGDCVIQSRPGDALPIPPAPLQARVSSRSSLHRDVVHLALDAGRGVDFLPGQFMLFSFRAGIGRRAYSMSNLPDGTGRLEFIVKRKPGGQASDFLFDELETGDRLDLEGPYGRAWLRDDSQRDIVLLAGGSGLAPIWSIAQAALQRSPQRRLRLYFGVNRGADLFWLTQFEQARRTHVGLQIHIVLMHPSPQDPAACRHGVAGDVMGRDVDDLRSCDLYAAGPPGLVDHVMRELVATGLAQPDRVFLDRFV